MEFITALLGLLKSLLRDAELDFDEAVRIYNNRVIDRDHGLPLPQPCAHLSELIAGVWHLRNESGLVARVGTATTSRMGTSPATPLRSDSLTVG